MTSKQKNHSNLPSISRNKNDTNMETNTQILTDLKKNIQINSEMTQSEIKKINEFLKNKISLQIPKNSCETINKEEIPLIKIQENHLKKNKLFFKLVKENPQFNYEQEIPFFLNIKNKYDPKQSSLEIISSYDNFYKDHIQFKNQTKTINGCNDANLNKNLTLPLSYLVNQIESSKFNYQNQDNNLSNFKTDLNKNIKNKEPQLSLRNILDNDKETFIDHQEKKN